LFDRAKVGKKETRLRRESKKLC